MASANDTGSESEETHSDTFPNSTSEETNSIPLEQRVFSDDLKCGKCNEIFTSSEEFKDHMLEHKKQKFKCDLCPRHFRFYHNFAKHKLTHTEETTSVKKGGYKRKSWHCIECHVQFDSRILLKAHLRTHQDVSKEKLEKSLVEQSSRGANRDCYCEYCGKYFEFGSLLKQHLVVHTQEKNYLCNYCDRRFLYVTQLNRHVRSHTGEKPYSCKQCDSKFASYDQLMRHNAKHTGIKYVCPFCENTYTVKSDLQRHVRYRHTEKRVFKCMSCDKTFTTVSSVKRHLLKFHDDASKVDIQTRSTSDPNSLFTPVDIKIDAKRPYNSRFVIHKDSKVPFSFTGKKDQQMLVTSQSNHSQAEPSHSTIFKTCYSNTKLLTIESNTDSITTQSETSQSDESNFVIVAKDNNSENIELFMCEVCENIYGSQAEIDAHVATHLEPEPLTEAADQQTGATFHCEFCQKGFASHGEYYEHLETEEIGNLFPCQQCDVYFVSKDELDQHNESHQDVIYHCEVCDVWKTSEAEFQQHFREKHEGQQDLMYVTAEPDGNALQVPKLPDPLMKVAEHVMGVVERVPEDAEVLVKVESVAESAESEDTDEAHGDKETVKIESKSHSVNEPDKHIKRKPEGECENVIHVEFTAKTDEEMNAEKATLDSSKAKAVGNHIKWEEEAEKPGQVSHGQVITRGIDIRPEEMDTEDTMSTKGDDGEANSDENSKFSSDYEYSGEDLYSDDEEFIEDKSQDAKKKLNQKLSTKMTKSKSSLVNENGEYECTLCSEVYPSAKTLRDHQNECVLVSGSGKPKVPKDILVHFKKFKQEQKAVESKKLEVRAKVDAQMPDKQRCAEMEKTGKFECHICYHVCKSVRGVRHHIHQKHVNSSTHKCEKCDRVFLTRIGLISHTQKKHEGKLAKAICDICGKLVVGLPMKVHVLQAHTIKPKLPRDCSYCGSTFKTRYQLKLHIDKEHLGIVKEKKDYKIKYFCSVCRKGFAFLSQWKQHEEVHLDVKPCNFTCELCSRGFSRRREYKDHMRKHTGETPFACPHCPLAFGQRDKLVRHLVQHTGATFDCKQCGKQFPIKNELRQHVKNVHQVHKEEDLRFACRVCSKRFWYKCSCQRHEENIHGIKSTDVVSLVFQ